MAISLDELNEITYKQLKDMFSFTENPSAAIQAPLYYSSNPLVADPMADVFVAGGHSATPPQPETAAGAAPTSSIGDDSAKSKI